jgi:anti-sigma regulatory factor (Ser/Thr protein kinase)
MNADTRIELANDLSEIPKLATAVEAFGAAHALSDGTIFALNLVLEEVVTNVISYGYAEPGPRVIAIELAVDGKHLHAVVADDAKAFNPLEREEPSLEGGVEERPVGGLGVHLLKTLMDDVSYRRENGRNILSMRKTMTEGNSLT